MCAVTSGFFRGPKLRCSGCWDTLSTELLPHSVFFFLRCTNLNHTFCCLFFSFFIVTSWKRTAFFSICLAGEIPKTRVLDRVLWRTRTNRINTCLVWEYGSARKHSLVFSRAWLSEHWMPSPAKSPVHRVQFQSCRVRPPFPTHPGWKLTSVPLWADTPATRSRALPNLPLDREELSERWFRDTRPQCHS